MVDSSKGTTVPIGAVGGPGSQNQYGYGYGYYPTSVGHTPGIETGTPADWFGPLDPLSPSAPPEVAGRAFDYPSGYNLGVQPRTYEAIKFSDLRGLAESYDVLRTIIETRKDQVVRLKWNIKPRVTAGGKKLVKPDDPILTEIRDFFMMPDGENFWDAWLRMLLEDLFVLDAPTLFCHRNRGGKMLKLEPIDGATIKRVIDDRGRTPQYPVAAYQQALKGLPAVNYTTRDLIYRPRNVRVHKVYGYSPVEQIVMTINIALRRQVFLLQYYTEGNVPEALIGAPENWNMTQIKEFQTWFDSILAGETGMRRRARFVPGGIGKTFIDTKEKALTGETDEWLTRVCCFAFSVSPTPFIKSMNRATADSAKEQALEEGLAPIQQYIKSLIDYIIITEFQRRDVEFSWEIPDDISPEIQGKIITDYVKAGIYSINKALDKLGEDPIEGGDRHMALLPTGWVPIEPTNALGASGGNQGVGATDGATQDAKPPANDDKPKPADAEKPTKKEVGKAAAVPFGKGSTSQELTPSIPDEEFDEVRSEIEALIAGMLAGVGQDAEEHVRASLQQLGKVAFFDRDTAARIARSINLDKMSSVVAPVAALLQRAASAAMSSMVGKMKATKEAVADALGSIEGWAMGRSAELVGMKLDDYGNLVANAAAVDSIAPSTVNMVEAAIYAGIEGGLTAASVAAGMSSTVFGKERAFLISNAETNRAVSFGAISAGTTLAGSAGGVKKAWKTKGDERVCLDICLDNEADGFIDMDAAFSSGDLMTPGHPRCRCRIVLQVVN